MHVGKNHVLGITKCWTFCFIQLFCNLMTAIENHVTTRLPGRIEHIELANLPLPWIEKKMVWNSSEERSNYWIVAHREDTNTSLCFPTLTSSHSYLIYFDRHTSPLPERKVERRRASCCIILRERMRGAKTASNGWIDRVFGRCCLICLKLPY